MCSHVTDLKHLTLDELSSFKYIYSDLIKQMVKLRGRNVVSTLFEPSFVVLPLRFVETTVLCIVTFVHGKTNSICFKKVEATYY